MNAPTTTMKQYQSDVQRTLSAFNRVSDLDPTWLKNELDNLVDAGKRADFLKKLIFYRSRTVPSYAAADEQWKHTFGPKEMDLLHAAIGLVSEAAELVDELIQPLLGCGRIDREKLILEFGDTQWYQSVGLTAIGSSFEEAGEKNIDKLKKRWPDKFVGGSETRG